MGTNQTLEGPEKKLEKKNQEEKSSKEKTTPVANVIKKIPAWNLSQCWNWPITEATIGHMMDLIGKISARSKILLKNIFIGTAPIVAFTVKIHSYFQKPIASSKYKKTDNFKIRQAARV